MKRVFFFGLALFTLSIMPAQAQTATDVNEGLRLTPGATVGTQVLSWWGKAGRTYFVQQSYDLITWTYLPVVHSGVGAPDGLNFACTDSRQFWRLRYPDPSPGGVSGAAGDADGDGRTNQAELNSGTDPLNADTDGDGWSDSLEFTIGSNGADAASTPPGVNPNFVNLIRSYDVQELTAGESYSMDWRSTGRKPGEAWVWSQNWRLPGDVNHSSGKSADKPTITYHAFPFTSLLTDTSWVDSGGLFYPALLLPDYTSGVDFNPTACMNKVAAYDGTTYKSESSSWDCQWYRYRLRLSQTLPYDYSESYLAIVHQYLPNPDYGLGGPTTDYRWVRSGIREVTPMTLTIPAGERTGAWKFQSPTVDGAGKYVAVQVVPMKIMQHPLSAASGAGSPPATTQPIRFCRWLDAYPNGVRDDGFADKDRDRFQIRIPTIIPGLTKLRIKTTGLHGAVIAGEFQEDKTTDGDYEVDLKVVSGQMVSESILLVSDGDDDVTFNGMGTDDDTNDQTLLADFGSQIIVSFQELGTVEATFQAQQPTGTITLDMVYCAPKADGDPPATIPQELIPFIERQAQKMQEIYRQIGIKVSGLSVRPISFPVLWVQDNGPDDPSDNLTRDETLSLMASVESSLLPSTRVRVGFVNAQLNNVNGPIAGRVKINVQGSSFTYSDPCLISINERCRELLNILAHEAAHTCALGHVPDAVYPLSHYRLMEEHAADQWINSSETTKRFGPDDANIIKNPPHYVPLEQ